MGGKISQLGYLHPGGQDKPAGISYPPGVKISRVGGKISRDSLPPGGQAVQGGKINCYTGSRSLGLFRKGKTCIIAKFHRRDIVISSHSRERKSPSYSQINMVHS